MSNFLVGNTNYAPVWKDHGTGGGTSYTLDGSGTAVGTLVYVGGSIQEPGVDYTISGTAITMTTSVTAGIGVLTCQLYALGTVNVPVDNSVTAAKTDLTLAEGSLIYGTGADAWTLLAKGAANQQLAMNAGATAPEWVTPSSSDYLLYQNTVASGGPFSPTGYAAGAWRTMQINTEVTDAGAHGSLSTNVITLAAGTYELFAAGGLATNSVADTVQYRFYNTSDSAIIASMNATMGTDNDNGPFTLFAEFTIAGSKNFELQSYASTAIMYPTYYASTGDNEVVWSVGLRKTA